MSPAPVVILTQEADDSAALAGELTSHGVAALTYPCIATRYLAFDPSQAVAGRPLADYQLLAFTSKRGAIGAAPARDVFACTRPQVACVGTATACEVEEQLGLSCTILPQCEATGAGLAQAILDTYGAPIPMLHIRGDHTTGAFQEILVTAGWEVAELVVYQNYEPKLTPLSLSEPVVVVLASPSAACRFFAANPHLIQRATCIAIGSVTSGHLRELGVKLIVTAEQTSHAGLVAAVLNVVHQGETYGP